MGGVEVKRGIGGDKLELVNIDNCYKEFFVKGNWEWWWVIKIVNLKMVK